VSVFTVLAVLGLALLLGVLGFAVGILLAPAIGRWAERLDEDEDDATGND
jgi:hypothetical protein